MSTPRSLGIGFAICLVASIALLDTRVSSRTFAIDELGQSAKSDSQAALKARALASLLKAVKFFSEDVAVEGGYVYCVSEDLQLREGEGVTDTATVWVQPPGTPAVGLAMVEAYVRTNEAAILEAAKQAAHCLVRGQLHSGGWQDRINFAPDLRKKIAYRIDGPRREKSRNVSTFDDDKTQAAVRFLATFDRATQFTDSKVHESVNYALQAILDNQFPNGGFAQGFDQPPQADQYRVLPAKYPQEWSRTHAGTDYWRYYTLNDNNISRIVDTLVLAHQIYGEPKYLEAVRRAADFLVLAQMPAPQPAWAQQYNFEMEPVWARKFEPPAISGSESQEAISTLMKVYLVTGDSKYLQGIPKALDYLQQSELEPGTSLARFYELETNRPLYFNRSYELTYEANDLPKHYGFIVRSRVSKLRKEYQQIVDGDKIRSSPKGLLEQSDAKPKESEVERIIEAMDSRGAWVDPYGMSHHKSAKKSPVIKSETFIRNIDTLSRFLAK